MKKAKINPEVTEFLNDIKHPLRAEIEILREKIINANPNLSENIKWNAPNYCCDGEDRITMKIQPPKQIQVVFHRGAKTLETLKNRLIDDKSKLLSWKTNDRAVATFRNLEEIISNESDFINIINEWLNASSEKIMSAEIK